MLREKIFTRANETLMAVMAGLDPRADDRIISICGTGAQPLGLLENVRRGRVLAVDNEPGQFEYAGKLIELIKKTDVGGADKIVPRDRGYFSRRKMKRIVANLGNLDFKLMDVTKKPTIRGKFTKGYFSNSNPNLKYLHRLFEKDALVYVTFATFALPGEADKLLDRLSENSGCDMSKLYEIDRKKTKEACILESTINPRMYNEETGEEYATDWTPCIFRRI